MVKHMDDLGGGSIELKAIEECTEELADFNQGVTTAQNVNENTKDIVDKGNTHFENKDSSDCKIETSLPPPETSVVPKAKRKFSLRKKSRVEFRVKPNVAPDDAKLSADSLNQISNVGRRSSVQAKRTRQSFSGRKLIVFATFYLYK